MKNLNVMFLLISLIMLISCAETTKDYASVKDQKPAYEVYAQNIHNEYVSNQIAAALKYQDSVIVVKGPVKEMHVFKESLVIYVGQTLPSCKIWCKFSKEEASSIAKIITGQLVRIKGKVSGDSKGGSRFASQVVLENCVIN